MAEHPRFTIVGNDGRIVPGKPWHVFDHQRDAVAWKADPDPEPSSHLPYCRCGCHSHGALAYFESEAEAARWISGQAPTAARSPAPNSQNNSALAARPPRAKENRQQPAPPRAADRPAPPRRTSDRGIPRPPGRPGRKDHP